jgi:hypothetical protein
VGFLRGGVKEVNAEAKGFTNGDDCLLFADGAENSAKRGGAKTNAAEFEARVAEWSKL